MRSFRLPILFLTVLITITCTQSELPKFQPFSKSVLLIELDSSIDKQVNIAIRNVTIAPYKPHTISIKTQDPATHAMEINVDRTSYGYMHVTSGGQSIEHIVILPLNDTSRISINGDLSLSHHGKYATINQYYSRKKDELGYANSSVAYNRLISPSATFQSIKAGVDRVTMNELAFLDKEPDLPDWFESQERNTITYRGANFKMMIVEYLRSNDFIKDTTVPDNYYDFTNQIPTNAPEAIVTQSYFSYLTHLFNLETPSTNPQVSRLRSAQIRHKAIRSNGYPQLSSEIQDIFEQHLFSIEIGFAQNREEVKRIVDSYDIQNIDAYLNPTEKDSPIHNANIKAGDTFPELWLTNELDSLISTRQFSDQIVFVNIWASWCKPCIQNVPYLNETIQELSDHPEIVFVNINLGDTREVWLKSLKKHHLLGTNLHAQGNWRNKLSQSLAINGIPRYVILGKKNVLINPNSEKPQLEKENLISLIR